MINRTNKLIGVTMNDMEKLNYLRLLRLAFSGQVKEIGYDKAHIGVIALIVIKLKK